MNPEVKMLKDCLIQLSMFALEAKEILKVISNNITQSPEIKKLIENLEISIMEADECIGLPIKCEGDNSCKR